MKQKIKVLSLYQPWATLIEIGKKRIETRSWSTPYRGLLAIHASKEDRYIKMRDRRGVANPDYICGEEPFCSILTQYSQAKHKTYKDLRDMVRRPVMPTGAIVAVCELVGCVEIGSRQKWYYPDALKNHIQNGRVMPPDESKGGYLVPPDQSKPEFSFGDYTPGRFAWLLANVRPLKEPVAISGRQGLWECELDLEALL